MLYINIPKINNKIKDIHTTQNTDKFEGSYSHSKKLYFQFLFTLL